ncbi:nucleotidyltransferase family protein [Lichenihabitans sp. Uapishka_5]|uniref:nucleotidyltransferase family protein n=1 Tax=Lichenihabitans sp. Uapishka_5 TaxID=3037302 RepID=UPI0029E8139F|nr:nucleotidyltransferase family protein [Lichenihabitans sp. Uapishka_5]MDX7953565.1 nucleotidyltransferase family protein [Lichenihabitans sp. Uapishka_5]
MTRPDAAMVFAAGLGTRMRPVTDAIPKPLVAVAGRTMLDHMLDRLAQAGVARAVVNVHYRADQIEAALAGRSRPAITVSDERATLLDQAGGIVAALPALGPAPFLICNTDALWIEATPALEALTDAWDAARMDVLLLVAATDGSVGVDWDGDFTLAPDGRLSRRREGRVPFVYAGVGIIKPELFAGLPAEPLKLAPFFFAAAERGRLHGVSLDGTWLHVGTPAAIGEAEAAFAAASD